MNALSPGPGEGQGKTALVSPRKRASRLAETPGTPRQRGSRSSHSSPRKPPPINKPTADPIATLIYRICTHPILATPTKAEPSPLPENIIKHMLSGTRAIALSVPAVSSSDMPPIQVQNTIAAMYILTRVGLSGKDITGEAYSSIRTLLCDVLEEIRGATADTLPGKIDAAVNSLVADEKGVDWLRNLRASALTDNVSVSSLSLPKATHDIDGNDAPPAETGDEPEQGREDVPTLRNKSRAHSAVRDQSGVAGIGRMLQDRVDFLGEKRRRLYRQWKEDIMERVAKIESEEHG